MANATAISFDAVNKSWLQITDAASGDSLDLGTSDGTIAGWFYFTTLSSYYLFCKGTPNYALVSASDGSLLAHFYDDVGIPIIGVSASGVVTTGQWYFIEYGMDRDGNAIVKVNNVTVITTDISGHQASINSSTPFYVGSKDNTSYWLDGRICGLGFWTRLFNDNDRSNLYNDDKIRPYIAFTPTLKTNLVSYWELSDGPYDSGNDAVDSHGSNDLSFNSTNLIDSSNLNGGFETTDSYGSNILINGNLDSVVSVGPPADFSNWIEYLNGGNIEAETTIRHTASGYSLKFTTGATSYPYVREVISTGIVEGDVYHLSFWTRGDGTNDGQYAIYDNTHSTYIKAVTPTGVTGTTWTEVTYNFVIPSGCTTISIYFWGKAGSGNICYFDDATLEKINGFSDWTETSSGSSSISPDGLIVNTGNYSARLDIDGSNNDAILSQDILISGKDYDYSLYSKGKTGTPSIYIDSNNHTLDTTFTQYTGSFTASGTSLQIKQNSAASNSLYFDDIIIIAINLLTATGPTLLSGALIETIGASGCDYTEPQDWYDAHKGDITSDTFVPYIGEIEAGSYSSLVMDASTTDSSHYFYLRAKSGDEFDGILDGTFPEIAGLNCSDDYSIFENFIINDIGYTNITTIKFQVIAHITGDYCIIDSCSAQDVTSNVTGYPAELDGFTLWGNNCVIRNSVIARLTLTTDTGASTLQGIYLDNDSNAYHNVIQSLEADDYVNGIYVTSAGHSSNVINNAVGTLTAILCFSIVNASGTHYIDYNAVKDSTSGTVGLNNQLNMIPSIEWIEASISNTNLHLDDSTSVKLLRKGKSLSGYSDAPTEDIDGESIEKDIGIDSIDLGTEVVGTITQTLPAVTQLLTNITYVVGSINQTLLAVTQTLNGKTSTIIIPLDELYTILESVFKEQTMTLSNIEEILVLLDDDDVTYDDVQSILTTLNGILKYKGLELSIFDSITLAGTIYYSVPLNSLTNLIIEQDRERDPFASVEEL